MYVFFFFSKRLRNIFSGPTIFSNVLAQAAAIAASSPQSQERSQYFVLLILTDGVVNDMPNTIDSIVNASGLPLSVLIVGVGSNDELEDMHTLDSDKKHLVARNGTAAVRDIVQFTALK